MNNKNTTKDGVQYFDGDVILAGTFKRAYTDYNQLRIMIKPKYRIRCHQTKLTDSSTYPISKISNKYIGIKPTHKK